MCTGDELIQEHWMVSHWGMLVRRVSCSEASQFPESPRWYNGCPICCCDKPGSDLCHWLGLWISIWTWCHSHKNPFIVEGKVKTQESRVLERFIKAYFILDLSVGFCFWSWENSWIREDRIKPIYPPLVTQDCTHYTKPLTAKVWVNPVSTKYWWWW